MSVLARGAKTDIARRTKGRTQAARIVPDLT
jgi:hypothetical protein